MVNDKWSKFKWLLNFLLEWKKRTYPIAKIGQVIFLTSAAPWITLPIVASFDLPPDNIVSQISVDLGNSSFFEEIISGISLLFGFSLITFDILRTQKKARQTAKVLVAGMLGTSTRFPCELLSFAEETDSRETVQIGISEDDNYSVDEQISLYNSEIKVRLYERFILHHNCNKFYLGGLSRVPFLVAYGACFRAVSASVVYFDRFHRDGAWKLLNDEDKSISLSILGIDEVEADPSGNIGLAIGFSMPIQESQLPSFIKANTIFVNPSVQAERNLIKNQVNLHRISEQIQQTIDRLSSIENCRKIHLFLSVQSTLALDIGRRYQEGIQKNWVIHNYNSDNGYDWAIELSQKGICRYRVPGTPYLIHAAKGDRFSLPF